MLPLCSLWGTWTTSPLVISHRARGATAALVFIHGFGGDPAKTWGEFPAIISA